MVTKYSVAMGLIAVADSDLQIRGGGHPDPDIRGVVSVWSNNIGGGPSLDPPLNCQPNLKIVSRSYHFSNNTKHWKKTEPP